MPYKNVPQIIKIININKNNNVSNPNLDDGMKNKTEIF